ncbi:WxL protein peptidoglycan domain-containing protein [Actinoplanes sp. CA-142083]|uniref:WxL protein peptidoglycan domain-containing protein n=1 Tax=Actinoplanes sp. CA-142083 TaxID=3239903 RepID=UPI003D908C56
MKIALVSALLAAVAAFSSAPPALADEGDVTWTVRTASNSYGNDRSSYSYSVNPGGTLRDELVVANRGKTPLNLNVYTADGFTTGAGRLDLRNRDDKQLGVGAWVRGGQATVAVPPGKTAQVPFTVSIPPNATPGDYVGGIVTTLTQPDATAQINVERRLGIRIKLRVSGELKPLLSVENLHVDYQGTLNPFGQGHATVSYTIHNTGNATLSAQQAVSAEGVFGWFRTGAASIAAPPELLPGESWKVSVPLKNVTPAFDLAVTASLTPLLTDASGSTSSLPPVTASVHAMTVPWTLVVLLVIVIALVVGAVFLSRRNRARRRTREDARVKEAVEQALREKETQAS